MSPLLRDSYTVLLAPAALTLTQRRPGLFGHALLAGQSLPCTLDSPAAHTVSTKPQPWQPALAALDHCLAAFKAGSSVSIELSNHFMRYTIVPAMPPFSRREQLLAVARHCLQDIYGDKVEQWTLQVNPLPHGDSVLACATDTALLAAIDALGRKYRLRIRSIQPHLMSGFNAARSSLKPARGQASQPACFVQLEPRRATLLLMRDRAWHAVAGCALSANWTQEVTALVSREMVFAGWQELQPTLYIASGFATDSVEFNRKFPPEIGWNIVMLPGIAAPAAGVDRLATLGQQA